MGAAARPCETKLAVAGDQTDDARAGPVPAQHIIIKGLIERQAAGSYMLADQGRAVLAALQGER